MPKYADPTLYPPAAPAADDAVMARTSAGGDKSFLLGNLSGLAPLTIANDQAPYFSGGAWGSYSLTAAGRALAGSLDSAAQRIVLGLGTAAIKDTGPSGDAIPLLNVANTWTLAQTFTAGTTVANAAYYRLGTAGAVAYGTSAGNAVLAASTAAGAQILLRPAGPNATAGQLSMNTTETTVSVTFAPSADNAVDVGVPARRIRTYYGVNSAINTSDARLKTEPRQLRDAEFKAASAIARLPAVWRWIHRVEGDEQNEPEGREARKHFGPTVQAAIAVMEAHELDPFAYSFICYDQWEAEAAQWNEWDAEVDPDTGEVTREAGRELVQEAREAGDRYSFRKEELLCFLVAAMARQHDELETRVAALEAKLTA